MKGVYVMGGYPTRERFIECFSDAADAGFDFIEAGIPFNDPVADGPVISGAGEQALSTGITPSMIMDDLLGLKNIPVKKYVMTYANIIYSFGPEEFSEKYGSILDGVIIADLPNRMAPRFERMGLTVPVVPFATLETREEDIELISRSDSEIIYFVGLRGTTGSSGNLKSDEAASKIEMLKRGSSKKIVIGFGIKTRADAETALSLGDGFVVGTEAVSRQENRSAYREYIKSLIR